MGTIEIGGSELVIDDNHKALVLAIQALTKEIERLRSGL